MHPFDYSRATDAPHALTSGRETADEVRRRRNEPVDLMKCDVERPAHLVDINALPLATIEAVKGGIRIGALARMSDVAANALVSSALRRRFRRRCWPARRRSCATRRRSAAT